MLKIDYKKLKRNPNKIKSLFRVVDNVVITNEDIKVIFPYRYLESKLANIINNVVNLLSIYAILDNNDNYGVMIAPIATNITPSDITDVEVKNQHCKLLHFEANSVFMPSNIVTKNDNNLYNIFSEFYVKGNVPWYVNYEDLSNLLRESLKYTDNKIGSDTIGIEIISSVMARTPNDLKKLARYDINTEADKKKDIEFVSLSDIRNTFTSTSARIIGGYLKEGIVTSILDKEKIPNKITMLLKS